MTAQWTHLHAHTQSSLLDGLAAAPALLDATRAHGMTHLAITDHGTMAGACAFYFAAKEREITPLLGIEAYVARRSRFDKITKDDRGGYHLILLAQDMDGYRNLVQLSTKGFTQGFYGKPRIDRELLLQHNKGLICTSACLSGEICRHLAAGNKKDATEAAAFYRDCFPGRYYLELQDQGLDEQKRINPLITDLAQYMDLPLVASNDVHYITHDHAQTHDVLLCLQTHERLDSKTRMKLDTKEFYLKAPKQMADLFSWRPDAVANTMEIALSCTLELPTGTPHLPVVAVPAGHSAQTYLEELAWAGVRKRYAHVSAEMEQRVSYELAVIRATGFASYFLLLWDILSWARAHDILVSPGRGSAVGSLVCYCLGITDVEPLHLGLLFERFLHMERLQSLPDVDCDVDDEQRDDVLAYVRERFGADHVAQISTYGTLGARAALKDTGRVLGFSYPEMDALTRLVPPKSDLDAALRHPDFMAAYRADDRTRHLIETARQLEGTKRQAGVHAAGVIIAPFPVTDLVPLCRVRGQGEENTGHATQYELGDVERLGLVKMDLLALSTLRLLRLACAEIARTTGTTIDPTRIPSDDPAALALLAQGETVGCFQMEGAGMTSVLKQIQPDRFEDVMAAVALYRPGPMEAIPTYIARKHGRETITYLHPDLEPILRDTYGVCVYQDSILRIALDFAGLTWGQVDKLRKAVGKKLPKELAKQKETFIAGFARTTKWIYRQDDTGVPRAYEVAKPQYPRDLAEAIWEQIIPFSDYGFGRSHAAAYATLAAQTAYLKAHHPLAFMAALLTVESTKSERIAIVLAECRRMGIALLAPGINQADAPFHVEGHAIRYGLAAVRSLGQEATRSLLAERAARGAFTSVEDAAARLAACGLPKTILDSLAKAGALDCFGDRCALLGRLPGLWAAAHKDAMMQRKGQLALFSAQEMGVPVAADEDSRLPAPQLLAWEKEILGCYLSPHPLHALADDAQRLGLRSLAGLDAGETVRVGVQISGVRTVLTKKEEPMAILTTEDLSARLDAVVFPRVYAQIRTLLQPEALLVLSGQVTERNERLQLIVEHAQPFSDFTATEPTRLIIRLRHDATARLAPLMTLLQAPEHAGDDPVELHLITEHGDEPVTPGALHVTASPHLLRALQRVIDPACVCVLPDQRAS